MSFFQNNVYNFSEQLKDNPILIGRVLVEGTDDGPTELISLSTVVKRLNHGLNQPVSGYLIIYQDENAVIYSDLFKAKTKQEQQDQKGTIGFRASADVKAKIFVF